MTSFSLELLLVAILDGGVGGGGYFGTCHTTTVYKQYKLYMQLSLDYLVGFFNQHSTELP